LEVDDAVRSDIARLNTWAKSVVAALFFKVLKVAQSRRVEPDDMSMPTSGATRLPKGPTKWDYIRRIVFIVYKFHLRQDFVVLQGCPSAVALRPYLQRPPSPPHDSSGALGVTVAQWLFDALLELGKVHTGLAIEPSPDQPPIGGPEYGGSVFHFGLAPHVMVYLDKSFAYWLEPSHSPSHNVSALFAKHWLQGVKHWSGVHAPWHCRTAPNCPRLGFLPSPMTETSTALHGVMQTLAKQYAAPRAGAFRYLHPKILAYDEALTNAIENEWYMH